MRMDKATGNESIPPIPERAGGTEHSIPERFRQAKAALTEADPFYRSESFWKAFEEGGVDEFQVAKLEAMVKAYRENAVKDQSPTPRPDNPIDRLLDGYDSGTIETVQDLADAAEALGKETGNKTLLNAVRAFRRFQREDWNLAGRGDSDEAEAALIAGMKRARSA